METYFIDYIFYISEYKIIGIQLEYLSSIANAYQTKNLTHVTLLPFVLVRPSHSTPFSVMTIFSLSYGKLNHKEPIR